MDHPLCSLFLFVCGLVSNLSGEALVFTSNEGNQAQFAGVLEARMEGLVIQIDSRGEPVTVPWERFDLGDLRNRHPQIHQARLASQADGSPVKLRLGIFSDAQTYEEILVSLASEFDKPLAYPVPDFDEYLENYGRQQMRRSQRYDDFAKQRARIHQDYQNFIREFFKNEVSLSVSRSHYSGNVFGSYPSKAKVQLSARHLLEFFADENRRGRREAMVYLYYYPQVLDRPAEILARHQQLLPSPLFNSTNLDHNYFPALLQNNRDEISAIQRERSFPHSAIRQFQRLIQILDEGRALQAAE